MRPDSRENTPDAEFFRNRFFFVYFKGNYWAMVIASIALGLCRSYWKFLISNDS
jgi:hypothetical protein